MDNLHNKKINRPVALIILDGWGYAPRTEGNAIAMAHTPNYDAICRNYPMTTLAVLDGDEEPITSEAGHMSIGMGRAAETEVSRIRKAVASGEFLENEAANKAFAKAKADGAAMHLVGLVSDGDVHSSTENLFAFLRLAKRHGLSEVFIHCILDGLDVPPRTADIYIEALEIKLADIGVGQIATLCGRFFAMDATENWERTARAFTMLVHAEGERAIDPVAAIRNSFLRGIADEFISPIIIESKPNEPITKVKNGDLVVFFNHRGDSMRQLVRFLCVPDGVNATKPVVETLCLVEYDAAIDLPVVIEKRADKFALTDILSEREIASVKITENARFSHLTNFFDGGGESQHRLDQHILVTQQLEGVTDNSPESQSFKIADKLLRSIESTPKALFVVNFPAADIMAATGDLMRTVAAIQYIDTCLGAVCEKVVEYGGAAIVTSTHGNCEQMIHAATGEPWPSGTANPVPLHYIDPAANGVRLRDGGTLADIAPTILNIFGLEKPVEMTGIGLAMV